MIESIVRTAPLVYSSGQAVAKARRFSLAGAREKIQFIFLLWLLIASTASGIQQAKAEYGGWRIITDNAKMRFLLPGGLEKDGHYIIGLEFLLAPGWHIYWRNPGELGFPTRVEFPKSSNIATVEVSYPAPDRLEEPYGFSNIYRRHVILPIKITPKDKLLPMTLDALVTLGLCKEICIPIRKEDTFSLQPFAERNLEIEHSVKKAIAGLPQKGELGSNKVLPYIESLDMLTDINKGNEFIQIAVRIDPEGGQVDLFAYGLNGFYPPRPQPIVSNETGGLIRFKLPRNISGHKGPEPPLHLLLRQGEHSIDYQLRWPLEEN